MTDAETVQGHPCRRCSGTTRYASNRRCVACKLAQGAAWRAANPERERERHDAWRVANRERARAATAAWRAANPERDRQRTADWRAANPERERERLAAWHVANPERRCAHEANRRARRRNAPGTHTADDRAFVLAAANGKCEYCLRCPATDVDHRMPLALGGTNYLTNLHAVCATCNSSKGPKHPDDWHRPAQVAREQWGRIESEPLWLPVNGGAAVALAHSPLMESGRTERKA